ncbi:hypothetical protein HN51_070309 [Arachis hypogaea]
MCFLLDGFPDWKWYMPILGEVSDTPLLDVRFSLFYWGSRLYRVLPTGEPISLVLLLPSRSKKRKNALSGISTMTIMLPKMVRLQRWSRLAAFLVAMYLVSRDGTFRPILFLLWTEVVIIDGLS